jgi:hypothetical protein
LTQYSLQILNSPTSANNGTIGDSWAFGVNNSGLVVGKMSAYSSEGFSDLPAWWSPSDYAAPLNVGDAVLYGGLANSAFHRVNNTGYAVGDNEAAGGSFLAYNTVARAGIPAPTVVADEALGQQVDINDSNLVLMSSGATCDLQTGDVASNGLTGPDGTGSSASAINNHGDIACLNFLYSLSNGELNTVSNPSNTSSYCWLNGVNENKLAVGYWSEDPSAGAGAPVYVDFSIPNPPVQLIPFAGNPPAGSAGAANAVNNAGTIVGTVTDTTGAIHTFVYQYGGSDPPQDLTNLIFSDTQGCTLTSAEDINESGQIVGNAMGPGGNFCGYIVTPVPPPVPPQRLWWGGPFIWLKWLLTVLPWVPSKHGSGGLSGTTGEQNTRQPGSPNDEK